MFEGGVNYQVNLWKRKTIFWRCLIEVSEVNTYSPLSPLIWGDNNIEKPIWVVRFFDDISLDELRHFFFYDFQSFRGELSSFLEN